MSLETESVESTELDVVEMFGEMEVRWYQAAARGAVEMHLENGVKRILVVQPTGSGKTLTSGLIFTSHRVRKALKIEGDRPLRLLFIAHKNRLLTQAEQTYAAASNVQLIVQSAFSDIPADVLKEGWDIACIDEAHHEAMMSIQLQLENIGTRPIIGLTATPDRSDGSLIKFEQIVNPISREQAVAEGWLASTHLNTFIDTPHADKTGIISDIIDTYGPEFGQTMIFVRTKAEVRSITDKLIEKGYKAVNTLDSSDVGLDRLLNDFSEKKHQFIIDCFRVSEGVDVKGCSHIILGRQIGSYPMLNQIIGRASRPDSECHVYELVNPLSGRNLDTTVVVGEPVRHRLIYRHKGEWVEEEFNYTTHIAAIESVKGGGRRPHR